MYHQETVRQLVAGSEAIDRMRKEIETVVHMLTGLVTSQDRFDLINWRIKHESHIKGAPSEDFSSPECVWHISENKEGNLEAGCWFYQICHPVNSGKCAYSTTFINGVKSVSLQDVGRVHGSLSLFIVGMVKTFPNLNEKLQPLLNAAPPPHFPE